MTTDKKRPEAIAFYKALGFVSSHEGMKFHVKWKKYLTSRLRRSLSLTRTLWSAPLNLTLVRQAQLGASYRVPHHVGGKSQSGKA